MSALSVTVLFVGTLFDLLDLTAVLFTALVLLMAREELGYKSLGIYFTTLAISFILFPNKLIAIEYAILSLYPFLKIAFDRHALLVKWLLRLAYFLLGTLALVAVMKLFMPDSPHYWDALSFVGFLLVFFLYDVLLHRFVLYYRFRLRNKLRIDRFFNQK